MLEISKQLLHAFLRDQWHVGIFRAQDFRVHRWGRLFTAEEHLLVQLLAWPRAGESDLDVHVGLESRQLNQVAGEIHDWNGFAHVEAEDFTTTAEHERLQHQLNRFRNGHEVATHFGMRNEHGSASANLPEERRHDRAATAKHVAKAHADVGMPAVACGDLNDLFGDAF